MRFQYFIEKNCSGRYSPDDERQASIICKGNTITIACMIFYWLVSVAIGFEAGIYIQIVLVILFLVAFILLNYKVPLDFVGNYIAGIGFFGVLSLCYFSGGLHSPVLGWISLVPIVSLLFTKQRYAVSWLVVLLVTLFIYNLTDSDKLLPIGYDVKYADIFYIMSLLGLISTYFFMSLIYHRSLNEANLTLFAKNKEIELEKIKSDDLLKNILPEDIAENLKSKGRSEARLYKNVSILFTDFVGFSKYCETISPETLINTLHEYFTAFDNIIEKYKLEKIKTIGDSYMAVCGLPQADPDHAYNAVRAGIEIREFVCEIIAKNKNGSSHLLNIPPFDIRIGIHSGTVIAGIIGSKKFAFDVWGDAVNIASRMEQIGLSQRVSISDTTFELVKDKIACSYQGKVLAKNKGELNLYTVDIEKMEPDIKHVSCLEEAK